jgi:hypothetical protein
MSFSVDKIRSAIKHGGARPTLFEVSLGTSSFTKDHSYLVRSAQFPGTNLNVIPVNYRGRPIKLAGTKQFDPWTMTMMNDEGSFRSYIVDYIKQMSGKEDGERTAIFGGYKSSATPTTASENNDYIQLSIKQLHKDGTSDDTSTYTLINAFPTSLGEIALDWGTEGFQEYTVTWRYDYFITGTASVSSTTTNFVTD